MRLNSMVRDVSEERLARGLSFAKLVVLLGKSAGCRQPHSAHEKTPGIAGAHCLACYLKPKERFELSTPALRKRCSAIELLRRLV